MLCTAKVLDQRAHVQSGQDALRSHPDQTRKISTEEAESDPFGMDRSSLGHRNQRSTNVPTTIESDSGVATLINIFSVDPQQSEELRGLLRASTEGVICKLQGWISTNMLESIDASRIIIYSQWKSVGDIEAMRSSPELGSYLPKIRALAAVEAVVCDVSYVRHA
jgi:quinol monooxygenase YgiN